MPKMPVPKASPPPGSVVQLVQRFAQHQETYKREAYNETQVRREFIDPLFTALGWDVDNRAGHAEAYKDVIHEDAIKIGGSTKAPDYCFRIGGVRKFFVEAKKPAVTVKDDPGPAYQLRRYAWTAKLPLAIVTDFEEFAVYDCRLRPKPTDKPATARVKYLTYDQYVDRWEEIAAIFSKDAILQGSFDKYAESNRRKRGTAEVDTEFLKEIERWRELLARNIALRNPALSVRDLNYAVSKTIDRLIFLRMCEDRGVETYAQLRILLNAPKVYDRLRTIFRSADDRYNSGLFYFQQEKDRPDSPDELTPELIIDDGVLKDIIKGLYYPDCPYEFSVLPAEILGQVYEQFLGKVIRLTKGHRAVVEEKPEVKKAGGVYYTPTYIVDYIVKHTVGKLLEDKTPADLGQMLDQRRGSRPRKQSRKRQRPVPTLRILDPACGSGSFLLGAYQYLLRWYLDYYTTNDPQAWVKRKNPPIHEVSSPAPLNEPSRDRNGAVNPSRERKRPVASATNYRLTIAERKRILLDHIYGVDIDPQAVEVTKLSLLLKVLEGESQQTLDNQLRLLHERALPDLAANIKCGNSLIAPDFYDNRQMTLLDEEERYRINVFDWQAEFPEVFDQSPKRKPGVRTSPGDKPVAHAPGSDPAPNPRSGFDAVIGNPPYIRVRILRDLLPRQAVEYLTSRYRCATHVWDVYLLFLERAYELTRLGGRFSFIVPIQTLHQPNCESLRKLLVEGAQILTVADLSSFRVFTGPVVKNCILVCAKGDPAGISIAISRPRSPDSLLAGEAATEWKQAKVRSNPGFSLKLDLLSPKRDICEKLRAKSWQLDQLCYVTFGLRSCARGKGQGGKERLIVDHDSDPRARSYLEGRDISRYAMRPTGRFILYVREEMYSPRTPALFETGKLISQTMLSRTRLVATLDDRQFFVEQSLLCIVPHGIITDQEPVASFPLEFILALVNCRLQSFYFGTFIIDYSLGGGLIHATPGSQAKLIIPKVEAEDVGRIAALARRMLSLHKQIAAAKTPTDKTAIQRQIDAADRQIDSLVYELYGLTNDEIRIVEGGTR